MATRVALVHDWLTGMRGGERVLEVLCDLYPDAHLYTLVHVAGSVSEVIERMDIRPSWIQRLPGSPRHFRRFLPLFPAAIESFDLRGYDLVISSSHCVAKGVLPDPAARHIAYLHTPMRYVWDLAPEYFHPGRAGLLTRTLGPVLASWLRAWDVASNPRVDRFLANSAHVARRIRRYYGREASVLHPPVDTEFYTPSDEPREHYLIVSALVPYKDIELAIAAAPRLSRPLLVVGDGPERVRLERLATGNVRFTGVLPRDDLRSLYRRAVAFLLPGEEDFGIAALEAQACGTPVVAYARGGALETVIDGSTGTLFGEPTPQSLLEAVDRLGPGTSNMKDLREHARQFSRERFRRAFEDEIEAVIGSSPRSG